MLEVQEAELRALSEDDYSEAYLAYRKRVEQIIKHYGSYFGKIGDLAVSGIIWIMNFFSQEGFENFPADGSVFTLDPAPFKDMIQAIVENSTPFHAEHYGAKTNSTDLGALKRFASGLLDAIAQFGVSKKTIQINFLKGIKVLLDSIEMKSGKQTLKIEKESNSVEVRKNGSVVIALFIYSYAGEIEEGCLSKNHEGEIKITVKIWKFPILADLKTEYTRITKRR